MAVNATHPDYDASLPGWLRARDVLAGEDAVKFAGEKYLPRLESQTDGVTPQLETCLLDACQSAWVFGGMGSWNDLGFEGPEQTEYDRVSERLFTALNETIQSAANASFQ